MRLASLLSIRQPKTCSCFERKKQVISKLEPPKLNVKVVVQEYITGRTFNVVFFVFFFTLDIVIFYLLTKSEIF